MIGLVIPFIFILGHYIWKRNVHDFHHAVLGTASSAHEHGILYQHSSLVYVRNCLETEQLSWGRMAISVLLMLLIQGYL